MCFYTAVMQQSDLFLVVPEGGPQVVKFSEFIPRMVELKAQGHWVHRVKVVPHGYELEWLPGRGADALAIPLTDATGNS